MFYRDCLIWSPWNAADLAAVFAGLFAASKVGPKSKRPRVWLALAVMSAFCEMLLFGMRVWNAQPRPDRSGDSPYPESAWIARFKSHPRSTFQRNSSEQQRHGVLTPGP